MLSLLSDFKRELLTTILDEGTSKMPIKRVQLNQNLIGLLTIRITFIFL